MAATEFDRRLAEIAIAEWWMFGSQFLDNDELNIPIYQELGHHGKKAEESNSGFRHRIWTYWRMGVYRSKASKWKKYRDVSQFPWSAAFISYCMRAAGAGGNFPYHKGHWFYVNIAMRNKINGQTGAAIVAYDLDETEPQVGDLLWYGTGAASKHWSYADLEKQVRGGVTWYSSHCDIVTEVDRVNNQLYAIGGNVGDRVLRLQSKLKKKNGRLKSKQYKVIIRNNITGP